MDYAALYAMVTIFVTIGLGTILFDISRRRTKVVSDKIDAGLKSETYYKICDKHGMYWPVDDKCQTCEDERINERYETMRMQQNARFDQAVKEMWRQGAIRRKQTELRKKKWRYTNV